jgi:thiamine biosynthesis lipoprotein
MNRLLASLFVLWSSLWLTACERTPEKHHQDFYVFGTLVGVTLWAADDEQARDAFAELQARFQAMHEDWHPWNPGLLTNINQAFADDRAVAATPGIVEMIRRSQEVESGSEGRFNPAIGRLVALWGFHTSDYPIMGPPPSAESIQTLLAQRPSSLDIRIDGNTLSSTNPSVQLDFGGIAKGYAIDIACNLLRARGIGNAIVNAGGDLRAIGRHGERAWRIAVRAPGGGVIGSIETGLDEAVFTSGNYERFRLDNEVRYPHILDPRTGWPVRELASVTVIADEGILADAAATAITVAGLGDWKDVARKLGLDQVMLVDENGTVYLTRKMSGRIELVEGTKTVVTDF